jgi:hypothetical protein
MSCELNRPCPSGYNRKQLEEIAEKCGMSQDEILTKNMRELCMDISKKEVFPKIEDIPCKMTERLCKSKKYSTDDIIKVAKKCGLYPNIESTTEEEPTWWHDRKSVRSQLCQAIHNKHSGENCGRYKKYELDKLAILSNINNIDPVTGKHKSSKKLCDEIQNYVSELNIFEDDGDALNESDSLDNSYFQEDSSEYSSSDEPEIIFLDPNNNLKFESDNYNEKDTSSTIMKVSSGLSTVYLKDNKAKQVFDKVESFNIVKRFLDEIKDYNSITINFSCAEYKGREKTVCDITIPQFNFTDHFLQDMSVDEDNMTIVWNRIKTLNNIENIEEFITKNLIKLLWDIGKALTFIHKLDIAHKDVSIDNIGYYNNKFILYDYDSSNIEINDNDLVIEDYKSFIQSICFRLDMNYRETCKLQKLISSITTDSNFLKTVIKINILSKTKNIIENLNNIEDELIFLKYTEQDMKDSIIELNNMKIII